MGDIHYAFYGNVRMERVFCDNCKTYSLVVDGGRACCDEPFDNEDGMGYKVMSSPEPKRTTPTQYEKQDILQAQDGCCFYCGLEFGEVVWDNRKKKARTLKINWDHFTPYAYGFNNKSSNFVASCNICNRLKSSKVFDTIDEAKEYMKKRWLDKEIYK